MMGICISVITISKSCSLKRAKPSWPFSAICKVPTSFFKKRAISSLVCVSSSTYRNGIVERRVRGQSKLRAKQSRNNRRFAKLRGLVELPFAFIKHHMNFRTARYLGIEKNQEHFNLLAACMNLRRVPQHIS